MNIPVKFLLWMNLHSPNRYTFVLFEPYCEWIPRAHTLAGYLAIGIRFYPQVRIDCPPFDCWNYVIANTTPAVKESHGFLCKTYPAMGGFVCVLEHGQKRIDCYWTGSRDDALDWFEERIGVELQMMETER